MCTKLEVYFNEYNAMRSHTYTLWEKRNKIFLILILIVGLSVLFTFNIAESKPLILDMLAKILTIDDPKHIKKLNSSLFYSFIQSLFMATILFTMMILYNRTAKIRFNYKYLSEIESDIKKASDLPDDSIIFTLESEFYKNNYPKFSFFLGIIFILFLGILLLPFLGVRLYNVWYINFDLVTGIIDTLLSILIIILYVAYAYTSLPRRL